MSRNTRCYLAAAAVMVASVEMGNQCAFVENPSRLPQFPPNVGTLKLHEDEASIIWDMVIPVGTRLPPHEHMFDYSFHVLEGSRLAVYSGEDANHLFSFDAPMGKTMAFKRHGNMMVDITGAIPPFPAVHGVMNIGKGNYREILVETKPCKGVPQNETAALRYDKERLRRALLTQTEPTVVAAYDEARSIEGVRASAIIGYSKSVNHESERALAQGFSHGMLYTLDEVSRELTTTSSADTMVFDFYPVAVKDPGVAEEGMQRVKHMVFVQFKIDAPVGKLVAGYIGLTTKISEMKGFEWGPIANKLGDEEKGKGFQYGFVTTFNSVEDCTAYNEHDAHKEYVNEVVPYAEDLLVFDILEHNSSE